MDNYDETALQLAVHIGNLSIIKLLEKHGADMNFLTRDGRTIVHLCVKYDSLVPLAYLRQKGFQLNCQDSKMLTPFHIAIDDKCPRALKFMSNWLDVDFNMQDSNGDTPLHYLVRNAD